MNLEEEKLINAVACGILKLRSAADTNDLICEYANEEAKRILGESEGQSWASLSSAYSLPIPFQEEILNFPNGKVYQVVKQQLGDEKYLFTLLDVSSENRMRKEMEDFLFIASHDLQEPLRKIISFGERIERNKELLGAENSLYLSRMMNATGRMQGMLLGLLSFSRIGQNEGSFAEVDLSAVAGEAFRNAAQVAGSSNVRFSVGKLPEIEANKGQMLHLFQELLVNALKFQASENIPEITVSSEVDLFKKTVRIMIADNGIGFDSEHTERVFLLFHRLNGRAEFEGAGIGLSVCKKIVDVHRGEIKAFSAAGKGTTMEVTLPLSQHDGKR